MASQRLSKVMPPLSLPTNEVLMEDMALYAERLDINALFQEYLKRILLEKPADPISFLMTEIRERPFCTAGPAADMADLRQKEVKAKFMERRDEKSRTQLLAELYGMLEEVQGTRAIRRAHMVVMLNNNPTLLLERFPHHANEIKKSIAKVVTETEGLMTWKEFKVAAETALSQPGGR